MTDQLTAYTVKVSEPWPNHPEDPFTKVTLVTVVTNTQAKACERARYEYMDEREGTRLYWMGGDITTTVVGSRPLYDGMVLDVDEDRYIDGDGETWEVGPNGTDTQVG